MYMMDRKFEIPKEIVDIVKRLNMYEGTKTYLVGGAVRDLLLGKIPNDWDLATNVPMEAILRIYPTHDIGTNKDFGLVVVETEIGDVEIAQFREDGNNRKDSDNVTFVDDPKLDSNRRDFTINSLYYDIIKERVIDYHDGLHDIEYKLLRFVGDAKTRIEEDPIRMLRAIRFIITNGFTTTVEDSRAIIHNCRLIDNVSKERILMEIRKTFGKCEYLYDFTKYLSILSTNFLLQPFFGNGFIMRMNVLVEKLGLNDKKIKNKEEYLPILLSCIDDDKLKEFPFSKEITNHIKSIKNVDLSDIFWDRFKFYTTVVENATDVLKTYIRLATIPDMYDEYIEKFKDVPNLRKTFNGTYINTVYRVVGRDIKTQQDECIRKFVNNI